MYCKLFDNGKSRHPAKPFICAAAVIMAVCSGGITVSANDVSAGSQNEDYVPDLDSTETKSLMINFGKDNDNGGRTGFPGAEFSIYKVADLTVQNGGAVYKLTSPYRSLAVYDEDDGGIEHTFDGLTSDESSALAKKLAEKADKPDASATTNADGTVSFPIKDDAMYLVMETNRTDAAAEYENVDPFLVSVPDMNPEIKQWDYAVSAEPKTEVKPSRKPHVNTGVKSLNVKRYTEITAIAGIICLILGICLINMRKSEQPKSRGRHNL